MFWILMACAGGRAPEAGGERAASVRILRGPWTEGEASGLSVAAAVPGAGGPSIILATWVGQDGTLVASSSLDSGRGWSLPRVVADQVRVGPGSPSIALIPGGAAVAYVREGAPYLATRDAEGWRSEQLADEGTDLRLGSADLGPAVLWRDANGLGLWLDGERVAFPVDGQVCGRPDLGRHAGSLAVVWRTQGATATTVDRAWRVDGSWQAEVVRESSWSACPPDGPVFDGPAVLVSDGASGARQLYRDNQLRPTEVGWEADQPRAAAGIHAWRQHRGDETRILIDDLGLLTSAEHGFELGDPVAVGLEVWLPFQGLGPTLVAYSPPPSEL